MKSKALFSNKPALTLALCMLLVALLPLTCGWVFYVQSGRTVRSQQERIIEQSMHLMLQKLDADVEEMSRLAIRVRQQVRLLEMPSIADVTSEQRIAFYDARQILQDTFSSASSSLDGMYLVRNGTEYAITPSAVTSLDVLIKTYWNTGVSASDLSQLHSRSEAGRLLRVGQRRLAYQMSLPSGVKEDQQNRQIVLVLSENYLNNLAGSYGLPGAHYSLCDREEQLLLDQGGEPAQDCTPVIRSFGAGSYQLVALIPASYVSGNSAMLRVLYVGLLGITLLLGALLIGLLSRRAAMPIHQLIDYIAANYPTESDENVEGLNLVFRSVEQMLNDHDAHLRQLQSYQEQTEMHHLSDAFLGLNREDVDSGRNYVVACFPLDDPALAGPVKDAVMAVRTPEYLKSCVFLSHAVCLLLEKGTGAMDGDEAERILEALLQSIDDRGIPDVNCAMSLVHASAREIEAAYREASMAAECMDDAKSAAIMRFDAIRYTPEYFLRDWHHLDKQLAFACLLSNDEYGQALEMLDSLFPEEFLRNSHSTLAQLHLSSLKYQFLHDMDTIAAGLPDADESKRNMAREILSCKTHQELLSLIRGRLSDQAGPAAAPEPEQDDQLLRIKAYIREHASDQQLSVTAVADTFGMPINRLSKLFSRYANMGVLQYIHKIRIENACGLLLGDEALTIAEVAARAGYTSTLTFNRAFKTRYQMTPSEYRRLHSAN